MRSCAPNWLPGSKPLKKSQGKSAFPRGAGLAKQFARRAGQWHNDYTVDFKIGLQPLLWHGQQGLTAGRRFQGALDSTLFLLSGPLPAAQGGSHAIVFTRGGSRFSTLIGKTCAWSVVALMLLISWEVFNRYALNRPHAWVLDAQIMLYGLLLMMAGAYTLSKNGHVRGDVLYGFLRPRTQAIIDLALYIVFLLPGVAALTWAG